MRPGSDKKITKEDFEQLKRKIDSVKDSVKRKIDQTRREQEEASAPDLEPWQSHYSAPPQVHFVQAQQPFNFTFAPHPGIQEQGFDSGANFQNPSQTMCAGDLTLSVHKLPSYSFCFMPNPGKRDSVASNQGSVSGLFPEEYSEASPRSRSFRQLPPSRQAPKPAPQPPGSQARSQVLDKRGPGEPETGRRASDLAARILRTGKNPISILQEFENQCGASKRFNYEFDELPQPANCGHIPYARLTQQIRLRRGRPARGRPRGRDQEQQEEGQDQRGCQNGHPAGQGVERVRSFLPGARESWQQNSCSLKGPRRAESL